MEAGLQEGHFSAPPPPTPVADKGVPDIQAKKDKGKVSEQLSFCVFTRGTKRHTKHLPVMFTVVPNLTQPNAHQSENG
jgi:hypothetical protein